MAWGALIGAVGSIASSAIGSKGGGGKGGEAKKSGEDKEAKKAAKKAKKEEKKRKKEADKVQMSPEMTSPPPARAVPGGPVPIGRDPLLSQNGVEPDANAMIGGLVGAYQ